MLNDTLVIAVGVLTLLGAVVVAVIGREPLRVVSGLGVVFLGLALLFAGLGAGMLAAAELFLYVGGVLVIFLFVLMLTPSRGEDEPGVTSRHDSLAFTIALGIAVLVIIVLRQLEPSFQAPLPITSLQDVAEALTGEYLVPFEIAGVLLLVALVAVVAIMRGDDE